ASDVACQCRVSETFDCAEWFEREGRLERFLDGQDGVSASAGVTVLAGRQENRIGRARREVEGDVLIVRTDLGEGATRAGIHAEVGLVIAADCVQVDAYVACRRVPEPHRLLDAGTF